MYAGNWLVGCKEDAAGDVTIADGTVGIANYAFYNCKFIGGVTIPDSVRSIGRGAFYNCRKLASATLPAGLTVLEDYTFYHCDALTLPTLPATLTGIGRSAFYKCALGEQSNDTAQDTLVIPDSVTYVGAFAFYGSGYSYADPDKVDTYIAGGIDILVIGSGVQTVGEQAFANFPSLRRVTLGAGSVVMAGAVINVDAVIGRGVIVNTCASVDHDCRIGDFCHVSVGARLAGTVHVGDRSTLGVGAVVRNNTDICADCMVGAGAAVVSPLTEPGVYVGVPARRLYPDGAN